MQHSDSLLNQKVGLNGRCLRELEDPPGYCELDSWALAVAAVAVALTVPASFADCWSYQKDDPEAAGAVDAASEPRLAGDPLKAVAT